ncbi:hypothetical protein [Amycolatopsis sp. GM8]|uniref:hypothetical protein n=1 Tax=Amycolatopsis sp. GM8 TaxID=2896530 RepID=UPI001F2988D6|nr:hypothetical protein [Amycolatopsis sp. GM8]
MTAKQGTEVTVLRLADLVAPSGVGYSELTRQLDGRPVILEGPLWQNNNELQVGTTTACAHGNPDPVVPLVEPAPALWLLRPGLKVRVLGIFEYGLNISDTGDAGYVRLRNATLASTA